MLSLQLAPLLKKESLSEVEQLLFMLQLNLKTISALKEIAQSVFDLFVRHAMNHFVGLLKMQAKKDT